MSGLTYRVTYPIQQQEESPVMAGDSELVELALNQSSYALRKDQKFYGHTSTEAKAYLREHGYTIEEA